MKITKTSNIQEIVEKHPQAAEVLFEEGIHCLGCAASHFETLEEGLAAHGKSDAEIKIIIQKLNKAVK